jgi:hypothetical protein
VRLVQFDPICRQLCAPELRYDPVVCYEWVNHYLWMFEPAAAVAPAPPPSAQPNTDTDSGTGADSGTDS